MKLNKSIHKYFLFLLTGILAFSSIGAVKYYQSNKINSDGTISIGIVYSASNQEIKQNNNVIGRFPFTQKLAKEYFTFPGGEVKRAIVYKDPKDSENRTAVMVELVVKDFAKISDSKALNDVKATWKKTDTGVVYIWSLPGADIQKDLIETYHFVLSSDAEIKSTNGTFKDKEVKWFVFGNKADKHGAYFVTTVKEEGIKIASGEDKSNKSPESKEESCGLFGIELPIIIFLGLVFNSLKKARKENF